MRIALAATAIAVAAMTTACGADESAEADDSTTASASASTESSTTADESSAASEDAATPDDSETAGKEPLPACSDVWQVGETLPENYVGCEDGDRLYPTVPTECPGGVKHFLSYKDRAYAIPGGTIVAEDDHDLICSGG